jgi:hypothetical protein
MKFAKLSSILLSIFIGYSGISQNYRPSLMIPFKLDDKIGYCDTLGKLIIQPSRYDDASFFYDDSSYTKVYSGGKSSLIDNEGSLLLRFKYSRVAPTNNKRYCRVSYYSDSKYYSLYDLKYQKELIGEFFTIEVHNDSVFEVSRLYDDFKFGLFDREGRSLAKIEYGPFFPASEVKSGLVETATKLITQKNGNYFCFDLKTNQLSEVTLEENLEVAEVSVTLTYGEVKIDPNAPKITKKNGRSGVMSGRKVLVSHKYDTLLDLQTNYVITGKDGKYGVWFIGRSYPAIKPTYEKIRFVYGLPVSVRRKFLIFEVQKNGKTGYLGENGVEYFQFRTPN